MSLRQPLGVKAEVRNRLKQLTQQNESRAESTMFDVSEQYISYPLVFHYVLGKKNEVWFEFFLWYAKRLLFLLKFGYENPSAAFSGFFLELFLFRL